MISVNVHEAKTQLSRLLDRVQRGEEIIIARAGKPVAKLSPAPPRKRAPFGFAKGTIEVVGEINDPMPDDWLDLFYNGPIVSEPIRGPRRRCRAPRKSKASK